MSTIYSQIYRTIASFENVSFEESEASVSVDEGYIKMTSLFIERAMQLMPKEFQSLYHSDYDRSSVKLVKDVKTGEQKVNSKFIQTLKKAADEYAKFLAGEWIECSKDEVLKEKFLEQPQVKAMIEMNSDAVIFARKVDEEVSQFYRNHKREQDRTLTVAHSKESGRCYIVGKKENVLKTIDELKKEYQPVDSNAN